MISVREDLICTTVNSNPYSKFPTKSAIYLSLSATDISTQPICPTEIVYRVYMPSIYI